MPLGVMKTYVRSWFAKGKNTGLTCEANVESLVAVALERLETSFGKSNCIAATVFLIHDILSLLHPLSASPMIDGP